MAETAEQLVVSLEARIRDFERNMQKASRVANDNWQSIENRGRRASRNMETMFQDSSSSVVRSLSSIGNAVPKALGPITTILSVEAVRRYADAWTTASNKIVAAGVKAGSAGFTTAAIADIAQRSRSDFDAVADLYARLTRSSKEFGASQQQISTATETVAKALKLSGATAAETSSTLIQLGQALGSGKLQGDELRSLLENAPVIAQSIAKEFGVATGELKKLGETGQLTSARVFKALVNAAPEIEKAFGKTTATTQDAFKALEAAAVKFVGQSASVKVATQSMGAGVNMLAKNFEVVATGAAALGVVMAVRLVAAGLTPAASALLATTRAAAGSVPALTALNATMLGTVAASNAGALSMRGLSGALALVGGPAGAAILGIGAAAIYFSSKSQEAKQRSDDYAAALERLRQQSDLTAGAQRNLGDQIAKTAAQAFEGERNALKLKLDAAEKEIQQFSSTVRQEIDRAAIIFRESRLSTPAAAELRTLVEKFKTGEISAAELREALFALANSNPNFQGLASTLGPLLTRLAGAIALTRELKAELGDVAKRQARSADDEIAKRIPNPTAGTSYDDDSDMVNRDPAIRAIKGQGIARRAVIEAEMDETKKAVRDKYNELRKTILDEGGTINPAELRKQAAAIVKANEGDSSGGSKARSSRPKKDEYDRQETSTERRIRELGAENEAIGKSAYEAARAAESFRLLQAAKDADRTITPQLTADIERLANAYAAAKIKLDNAKQAQEEATRRNQFFRDQISSSLADAIVDGKRLTDVFRDLAKAIAKAAIQAALFGQGSLGGLVGGSGGGILSMLLPVKAASGGYISGPGSATSDSIPARLSNGEFVVNAASTRNHRVLLEAINAGKVRSFASGGIVRPTGFTGAPMIARASGAPTIQISAPITVNGSAGTPAQNADLAKRMAREFEKSARTLMIDELRNQMRPGNLLSRTR
ncbi:MAG: tape measure protein [Beijerinckiaceae bacterium]